MLLKAVLISLNSKNSDNSDNSVNSVNSVSSVKCGATCISYGIFTIYIFMYTLSRSVAKEVMR